MDHDSERGGSVGTPDVGGEDNETAEEDGDDDDDDGFDAAFAAEIDQVDLDGADADGDADADAQSSSEEDEGGLFGEGPGGSDDEDDEDDDDDEDDEIVQTRKLLNEEIRDLEAAVDKKVADIAGVQNQLIKVRQTFVSDLVIGAHVSIQRRFEDALKKLRADLDSRLAQRQQLSERKLAKDQARAQIEEDSINVGVGTGGADEDDGDGDDEEDEEGEGDAGAEVVQDGVVLGNRPSDDAMNLG